MRFLAAAVTLFAFAGSALSAAIPNKVTPNSDDLTIIEVDGNNVLPLLVDSLEIFAGQRYSVVILANRQVPGSF